MIIYFKAEKILDKQIKVQFLNEIGQDVDGVSRDAYAFFWQMFMQCNAEGEHFRIPILDPDFGKDEWQAIGRILLKGYQDHRYFPVSLAPAFMVALVYGEDSVPPSILKESFLQFITPSERDAITKALAREDFDQNVLLDLLERTQCHRIPEAKELLPMILHVAHKEIIQESSYAIETMRSIDHKRFVSFFPDCSAIMAVYDQLEPSVSKVLNLLEANPQTTEQNKCLSYFQRFIRGRSSNDLGRLLRFLTGADVICVEKIQVSFIKATGLARRPIIHTCGPSVELPETYLHFPDFRSEWEHLLANEASFEMNLA
jgi:hypothetical protein